MKFTRFLMYWLAAGVMAAAAGARGADTAPTTVPATNPATSNPAQSIQAIQTASDPSSAVDAYGKALAGGADKLSAERIYLTRMTDFALPEMADSQALDLILRDPSNGLAWAVAAHMSARRGNMAAALGQIETAINFAPRDPFVQRTAGNIIAWYDARGASVDIPDVIKNPIPDLRKTLLAQPAFAMAYQRASDDYKQPATTQPVAENGGAPYTEQIPMDTYVSPYSYPGYSTAYNYYTSPPPYWYPSYSSWCGWNSGWGTCSWPWWGAGFVVVNNNGHFHDGHFHDDHFHDGHFHGNDGFVHDHGQAFFPHNGATNPGGFRGGNVGPNAPQGNMMPMRGSDRAPMMGPQQGMAPRGGMGMAPRGGGGMAGGGGGRGR